ncbi:unnamed protein product [Paramecium octaurelia]|uniref:10 kDa heat shock protein, mitochondrial n=1 Tax=Paramecium octaurelia TaxID=43137 RepID=A0A8S1VUF7_PAROT|nr:unnamed protein product [Paramecium octaurelia]
MASQFKKLAPLLNRVLIQKYEPVTKTASGILLQTSDEKQAVGKVVEAGPGQIDSKGNVIPTLVKPGDVVLLPDYGGQKIKLADQEYFLFRDSDIIGILHQ